MAGTAVLAIGYHACRHTRGRSDHLLLATLPLLLGTHQLIEDFVWWGLQGHVPQEIGRSRRSSRLGLRLSGVLLATMVFGPTSASLAPCHLAYRIRLDHGVFFVVLYVVAICGSLLFSGYRHVAAIGIGNVVAVAMLATHTLGGFALLWCVYAACTAGAIALHMRYAKPHRAAPYVLT